VGASAADGAARCARQRSGSGARGWCTTGAKTGEAGDCKWGPGTVMGGVI
jgi:hypothetical protein